MPPFGAPTEPPQNGPNHCPLSLQDPMSADAGLAVPGGTIATEAIRTAATTIFLSTELPSGHPAAPYAVGAHRGEIAPRSTRSLGSPTFRVASGQAAGSSATSTGPSAPQPPPRATA